MIKLFSKKITIIDLVILSKFESSRSEIRRLIKGNAVKLNNKTINSDNFLIENSMFNENYLKLSIGKKDI